VRELEHAVEGAVTISHGDVIEPQDLVIHAAIYPPAAKVPFADPLSEEGPICSLEELEKSYIEKTLRHFHWNRAKTAATLGITAKTLYLKIKRYHITVPHLEDPL
jgi:DNA-binding NtrC family response regulator